MANFAAFLSGLGQGLQRSQQISADLKMRAEQLQQAHMANEAEKRKLGGLYALFQGLGQDGSGFGGGQTPQPPMPGQPSVPMQQPQGGGQMTMQPAQGQPSATMQGAPAPMQPQQPTGAGGAPVAPGGQDPFSVQGQYQAMQQIAQEIRRRNPGIDPQTLSEATMQAMDIMRNLSAVQRPAQQLALVEARGQQAQALEGQKQTGREVLEDQRQGGRMDVQRLRGQQAVSRAGMVIQGAMDRARFVQQSIDARASSGQGNKTKIAAQRTALTAATTQLNAAQRQLSSLANAGVTDEKDPRVQAAMARVQQAQEKIELVAKAAQVQDSPAPQKNGANKGADPLGIR